MFVQVAIAGPFLTPFDYSYDESLFSPVVGGRVRVSFRHKKIVALVVRLSETASCDESKVKPIAEVLDTAPLYSSKELAFLKWASHYYHEPIGNVLQAALPNRVRQGEALSVEGEAAWHWVKGERLEQISIRASQQRAIAIFLKEAGQAVSAESLNQSFNNWRVPIKKLISMGVVQQTQSTCLSLSDKAAPPNHLLNEEQLAAINKVRKAEGFEAFLLEGITGSGKTETYLGMIEQVLSHGKQVLVLVPEIGLTPQTVQRFESFLQEPVAVMHSGLNDKERHCAWHLIRTNQIKVLLGTRSALFTPFANLGLCVLDEEHDLSFKQQDGFRYSARDCLVRRAQMENIPVVLGSATPAFESLYNAKTDRYQLLKLNRRATGAELPTMQLLDVRGERLAEGVSSQLKARMTEHLDQGGQVLLFLNRRGFAPVLMCHECGWQAGCPSCDANMTWHGRFNELHCHHCGYKQIAPKVCPDCESETFVPVGQGTERLQSVVESWFPDQTVLRIDRDTTRRKGQMEAFTEKARKGEANILIGTQMLAKGHHFPKVTLVGLVDIDQGLFSADFRSAERMAQLIVQVAGRAGRAEKAGEVVIQTHHPDHPLLKTLVSQGYRAFADRALNERQVAELPPYTYGILIRAESMEYESGWQFLNDIKQSLAFAQNQMNRAQGEDSVIPAEVELMGPVSAPMLRRQGRFRYQLWLQSANRSHLHQLLGSIESYIYASQWVKKVRWNIDVDPQEMF